MSTEPKPPRPRELIATTIRDLTEADPHFNYYAAADTIIGRLREAGYRIEAEAKPARPEGAVAVQRPGAGSD